MMKHVHVYLKRFCSVQNFCFLLVVGFSSLCLLQFVAHVHVYQECFQSRLILTKLSLCETYFITNTSTTCKQNTSSCQKRMLQISIFLSVEHQYDDILEVCNRKRVDFVNKFNVMWGWAKEHNIHGRQVRQQASLEKNESLVRGKILKPGVKQSYFNGNVKELILSHTYKM